MSRAGPVCAAAATAWLFTAAPAAPQDATPLLEASSPTDGQTALEQYLDERDRLIIERIQRQPALALGGAASLEMEAVVAFEPARLEERMLGIRIRVVGTTLTGRAALTHLDLREVEELVRAIDLMDELIATEPEGTDTEVRHISQDGFGVVAKRTGGSNGFALRFHGTADGEPVEVAIDVATLARLRGQLDGSRRYLFQQ